MTPSNDYDYDDASLESEGCSEETAEIFAYHAGLFNYGPQVVEPRFRYFQRKRGPMYCWTTEPDAEGWYWSSVSYPTGPGARCGKATCWRRSPSSARRHRRRKDAKARALLLYGREMTREGPQ